MKMWRVARWGALVALTLCVSAASALADQLTLDEAMERAVENTEAAELLRLQVEAALGTRKQALGDVLPTLDFGASVTLNDRQVDVGDGAFTNRWDPSGSLQGRVDLFRGTSIPNWLASGDRADAERERMRWERSRLRFAAAEAYLRAITAARNREDAGDALRVAEESLRQAEVRQDTGYGLRSDVSQARLAVLEAETERLNAERDEEDALDRLAFLVNVPRISSDSLTEEPSVRIGGATESERSDLAAFAFEESALDRTIRGEKLAFLPSLSLNGQWNQGRSSLRAPDGRYWQLTLSANFIIFDFSRYGRLDELRANRDRVELQRREREREVHVDLRIAERRLQQATRQLEVAEEAVEVAEESQQLVQDRFELGETTAFEVVEADNALFRARSQRNRAELEIELARVELAWQRGALQDEGD